MECKNGFYNSDEIDIEKIVPVYQNAFAEEPWFERGKCDRVDCQKRSSCCPTGFSRYFKGETCPMGQTINEEAYTPEELRDTFSKIENGLWYLEFEDEQLALAALAWQSNARSIADKKYPNKPEMADWMDSKLSGNVVWLDEVFRDKNVRAQGNLANFGSMVCGILERLNGEQLAYRTVSEAMISKPRGIFPEEALIYRRDQDVPDGRDFVIINVTQKGTEQ